MSYFTPKVIWEWGLEHLKMLLENQEDPISRFIMDNIVVILDNIKAIVFPEEPDAIIVEF